MTKKNDVRSQQTGCVYRLFNKRGELLYIGCSKNVLGRLPMHYQTKPWAKQIRLITIGPRRRIGIALYEERVAIATEKPKYNLLWTEKYTNKVMKSEFAGYRGVQFAIK